MKSKYNTLTCLFGHHDYSQRLTRSKDGFHIRFCKVCRRSGYKKATSGEELWTRYTAEGKCIHIKYSDGFEVWLDNDGVEWEEKKPKNWEYDSQ